MSMSPRLSRVAMNVGSGVEVLASTFWPIRVRLKPIRDVLSVPADRMRRYSPVKNWLRRKEGARELRVVGRQELVGVVEGVAREQLVAAAQVVVDAPLHEVLVELLAEREGERRQPLAERRPVGARVLRQVGRNRRADRHRAARQQAEPGVVVRHHRADRAAEPLDQRFVAEEEERAIAADRPADGAAELVAPEVRLLAGVEEVAGVEGVVAVKGEERAVHGVGARLGDGVDLAAGVAAELGAVGVGLDAELADRLDAERGAGGAARRAVGEVVLDGAVEQVDVRPRILSVHAHPQAVRDHRAAVAVRIRQHPRLEERQVGVVAPVERQLLDGGGADQVAQLGARRVDDRGFAGDGHLFGQAADLERDVLDQRLRHAQLDLAAHVRLEAGQLGAQLVGAGRQDGNDVAPLGAGDGRTHQRGVDVAGGDAHARQHAAVGVLDGPADRGGRLRPRRRDGGRRAQEQQPDGKHASGHRARHQAGSFQAGRSNGVQKTKCINGFEPGRVS